MESKNEGVETLGLVPVTAINSGELALATSLIHIEAGPNEATNDGPEATIGEAAGHDMAMDLEFAKELDRALNQETVPLETLSDSELARQLQQEFDRQDQGDDEVVDVTKPVETIELLDDDDDVTVVESTYQPPDVVITGASSIKFVIEELGITYNAATSFDWKRHEIKLDINAIFQKFNKLYFNEPDCFGNVEIGWTTDLGIKPARLRILPDKTQISLNHHLKFVQRVDLITHLLRVMLIIYIRERYGLANNVPAFKRNLVRVLNRLNNVWLTNITEDADIVFNHQMDKRCWYRCTGICQNYAPFFGIYRSKAEPGGQCSWWLNHRTNCSATLFRLYEVRKYVDDSPAPDEQFFVTNVKHRSVKIDLRTANKTLLKPTVTIDLASESYEPSSSDHPYIDIIDMQRTRLYEHRLTDPIDRLGFKPADEFLKLFDKSLGVDYNGYLIPCPLCQEKVNRRLFAEHLDGCLGFSKKVEYKPVTVKWDEWPNAKRIKY